ARARGGGRRGRGGRGRGDLRARFAGGGIVTAGDGERQEAAPEDACAHGGPCSPSHTSGKSRRWNSVLHSPHRGAVSSPAWRGRSGSARGRGLCDQASDG